MRPACRYGDWKDGPLAFVWGWIMAVIFVAFVLFAFYEATCRVRQSLQEGEP